MNRGGDTNKINEYGQYQYWLDPTKLFVDTVTKNLKLDTRNILTSDDPIGDFGVVFTLNIVLKDRLTNSQHSKIMTLRKTLNHLFLGVTSCGKEQKMVLKRVTFLILISLTRKQGVLTNQILLGDLN